MRVERSARSHYATIQVECQGKFAQRRAGRYGKLVCLRANTNCRCGLLGAGQKLSLISFVGNDELRHGRSTGMNQMTLLDLTRHSLIVALELALPVLLISLIVGVLVSLFQAVTQIQEMTLTFVPKVLAITAALVILGPWMLSLIVTFTSGLFTGAPGFLRHN